MLLIRMGEFGRTHELSLPTKETVGIVPLLGLIEVQAVLPAWRFVRRRDRCVESAVIGVASATPMLARIRVTTYDDRRKVFRRFGCGLAA